MSKTQAHRSSPSIGLGEVAARRLSIFYNAILFLSIPAYLYLNLFTLHGVPHLIVSDDGLFVLDGLRMGAGQWIYRDFFQFNAPGIDYVFFFAFKLFGARAWVPNLVTLLIGTSVSWIAIHLGRRIMPRSWADLCAILFVVFAYGRWLDATHHWISLFAILLAINVLIPGRTLSRLAVAGILIGWATFFTQTAGAAAWLAFAISLLYEHSTGASRSNLLRQQATLIVTAALTWVLLSGSTLLHVGWHTLWYFQVTFPQRYELRFDDNPLGVLLHRSPHGIPFLQAENILFYLLLVCTTPLALGIIYGKRLREWSNPHRYRMPVVLLASAGCLLMAEVVSRPTWIRLYADLLPSLMIFFTMLAWLLRRRRRLSLFLITALWSAAILSAVRQIKLNRAIYANIATLPAGKIALRQEDAEEFRSIAERTQPGDLFFQAFGVHMYLPLALHSPVYMDYLRQSSLTRPEFQANAIEALQTNHVKYIVLRPAISITFHSNPADSHHLDSVYSWIETHYKRIQRFQNQDELWELQR